MTNPIKANSSIAGNMAYGVASVNLLLSFSTLAGLSDPNSAMILLLISVLFSFILYGIGSITHNSKRSAEYLKLLVKENR